MRNFSKNVAINAIYSHHVLIHTLAVSLLEARNKVTIYVSAGIFKDLNPIFSIGDNLPEFRVSGLGKDNSG